MTGERWSQVKAVLAGALELEQPAARRTFLEQTCGIDTQLRGEVEALLAQSTENLEQIAQAVPQLFGQDAPSRPAGERIGAYRIVRELGRGGMGAVYLAERADGSFEREVAIKILKRGTDTDEILRRFHAERRILAQLDHLNIARLLDAGTTADGLPYFVMEYVAGEPVTAYANARQLSQTDRLKLFLQICAAVQFAHENGIVHRDLKPGNILINAAGEPKLLDFGIAKLVATDGQEMDLTRTAQQRFTPVCVSPEQARGEEITPASDVYALGALLYELLTGATPHQFPRRRPSHGEVIRILEQEPPKPSERAPDEKTRRQLRGDLDTIVLFALRQDPTLRYASVAALAEDIRRFLQGHPIEARPRTIIYRTRRFVHRHRHVVWPALGAAALALLLLLPLLLFLLPGRNGANIPMHGQRAPISAKSIAVLPFESVGGKHSDRVFAEGVRESVTTDLARVADLKVVSQTKESGPSAEPDISKIGRSLGVAHLLRGTVRRAANRVRVNVQLIDSRNSQVIWAEQYDRELTDLFSLQSQLAQQIVDRLRVTLSPREQAAINRPPTNDFEAYDLFLRAHALVHNTAGYGPAYRANATKAIELLHQAVARDPHYTLAYCLLAEAHLYLYRYNFDHTPQQLEQAQAASDAALRSAPDSPESHLAKARLAYFGTRDFPAAAREVQLAARDLQNNPDVMELSALIARRLGDWERALRDGRRAIELDPQEPARLTEVIETCLVLRRYHEANRLADEAIASLPPKAADYYWWHKSFAALAQGKLEEAQRALESATSQRPETHLRLGEVFVFQHRFEAAEQELDALSKIWPDDERVYLLKATIARTQGNETQARAHLAKARELIETALRKEPNDPALISELGVVQAGLGEREAALRASNQAVALLPTSRDAVQGPVLEAARAEVYASLGERELAMHELARLVRTPGGPSFGELKLNPVWDSLRDDARFHDLLKAASLPLSSERAPTTAQKTTPTI
jgi:eukaryotic-like serine/threonine-protein kinase